VALDDLMAERGLEPLVKDAMGSGFSHEELQQMAESVT
jgi:hypothetical protein